MASHLANTPVQLYDLSDRVALITGASRGIGLASARLLAQAGARVFLVARESGALEAATAEVVAEGLDAAATACDVAAPESVDAAVKAALETFGQIDILVNNAGIAASGRLDELSIDDWDEMLKVNLRGAFLCSQAVVPGMRERGRGVVVNMASISGQTGGLSASLHYAASKGGLIAFTKALARQMAPWGRANAIAPGQIATAMGARNPSQVSAVEGLALLRRLGTADEVAAGVLFLASPASSYITGQVLNINGGLL
jgi:NAD(P)-dependent dehydrogenase (short-subunit alcohol dehydrogenase family)